MKTFTVVTKGMEGTFIISNSKEELDRDIPELALGETSGSPKELTRDYIHLLTDFFYPRYEDTQIASLAAFSAVLKKNEIGGMIFSKLIPDEGVEVDEKEHFIAPEGDLSMN
jgi:hypothetical protein